jgi:hypothetical protein
LLAGSIGDVVNDAADQTLADIEGGRGLVEFSIGEEMKGSRVADADSALSLFGVGNGVAPRVRGQEDSAFRRLSTGLAG